MICAAQHGRSTAQLFAARPLCKLYKGPSESSSFLLSPHCVYLDGTQGVVLYQSGGQSAEFALEVTIHISFGQGNSRKKKKERKEREEAVQEEEEEEEEEEEGEEEELIGGYWA